MKNQHAAPTNGQVLTATSSTTATWQTPSGGGSKAYACYTEQGGVTYTSGQNFALGTLVISSGSFSNSGGVITIPTAGIYLIIFSSVYDSSPNLLQLQQNSITMTSVFGNTSANEGTSTINYILTCAAGDSINIKVDLSTGSITTANESYTNLTINQIG